jgi:hypothetical protein
MISWVKVLIIGHARHGKDTFAKLLEDIWGIKSSSSSDIALNLFMWDILKVRYNSPEECYLDRVNNREIWYKSICDYNQNDKTRLAKDILKVSNCYVGMRDKEEFLACKSENLFDLVIWVDASERLETESSKSFNILKSDADIIIDNNSDLNSLREKAKRIGRLLF